VTLLWVCTTGHLTRMRKIMSPSKPCHSVILWFC